MDPLNVKQALRALVANTPREPAPVNEPERDPIKRLGSKIQTDIVKEAPPGLLERAGSTAASGLSAVGNLLDVPGSMARDVLTWLPGGPKPANPFDQLLSPFSEKNRTTGRDLNRGYGLSGKENTMLNFIGGMGTEILTDPLTYLTLGAGALTRGGAAAKAAGLMDDAPVVASKLLKRNVGKREARHIVTPRMLLENVHPTQRAEKLNQLKSLGMEDADLDKQLGGMLRINKPFSDKPFRKFDGTPFTFGGLTDESGVVGAGKIKMRRNPLPPLPPSAMPPGVTPPNVMPPSVTPPTAPSRPTQQSLPPNPNSPSTQKTPTAAPTTPTQLDQFDKSFVDGITNDQFEVQDSLDVVTSQKPSADLKYFNDVLTNSYKQKTIDRKKFEFGQQRLADHYAKLFPVQWNQLPEGNVLDIDIPDIGKARARIDDKSTLIISDVSRSPKLAGSGKALLTKIRDTAPPQNFTNIFMPIDDKRSLAAFTEVFGKDNLLLMKDGSTPYASVDDAMKAAGKEPVFVFKAKQPVSQTPSTTVVKSTADSTQPLVNTPTTTSTVKTAEATTPPTIPTDDFSLTNKKPETKINKVIANDIELNKKKLVDEVNRKAGASEAEITELILRGDTSSAIRRIIDNPLKRLKLDVLMGAIKKHGIMPADEADDIFAKINTGLKRESVKQELSSLGGDTGDIVDGLLSNDPVTSLRAMIYARNLPHTRITDIADQLASSGVLDDYNRKLINVEAETADILKKQYSSNEIKKIDTNTLQNAEQKEKLLEEIQLKAKAKADEMTSRRDSAIALSKVDQLEGASQFLDKLRQTQTPLGEALVARKRDMLALERVGDKRQSVRDLIKKKHELTMELYQKRFEYANELAKKNKIDLNKIDSIQGSPLTTGFFDDVDRAFIKEKGNDAELLFKNLGNETEEDFYTRTKKAEGRSSDGMTLFSQANRPNPPYQYGSSVDIDWKKLDPLPEDAKKIVGNMVSKLDERFLDGITLRYGGQGPDAGAMARIDLTNGLIDIFDNSIKAGRVTEDTVHEMWHHLSRYFTDEEVRSVSDEYQRSLAAFAAKSPNEPLPYHLTSIDEYVGKTMADLSIKYLGKPKPEGFLGTAWGKMLEVFEYLWDTALKTLGYNKTKSIMTDFLSGKRLPQRLSDNSLASRVDGAFDTNLQSRLDNQTKSPAFKNWFGDWEKDPKNASKVVDAEGKPLVVYHGTRYSDLGVNAAKERNRITRERMAFEKEFLEKHEPKLDELRKAADVTRKELEVAAKELAEKLSPDKYSLDRIASSLAYSDDRYNLSVQLDRAWDKGKSLRSHTSVPASVIRLADDAWASTEPLRQKLRDIENQRSIIPKRSRQPIGRLEQEIPFFDTLRYGENDEGYLSAGSYFTADKELAGRYAGSSEGSGVIPVYLNLKNPYIHGVTVDNEVDKLANKIYDSRSQSLRNAGADVDEYSRARATSQREALIERGYDGEIRDSKLAGKSSSFADTEYVAFYPEQIKSAIGNRGTFDPTSRNILESRTEPNGMYLNKSFEDEWFVKSTRAVSAFPMNTATAGQWEAAIKKAGITKEEIEDLNLESLFAEKSAKLTKEQVLKHIADNTPQITVVEVKGAKSNSLSNNVDYSKYAVPVGGTERNIKKGYIEIIVYGRSSDQIRGHETFPYDIHAENLHFRSIKLDDPIARITKNSLIDDLVRSRKGFTHNPISWARAGEAIIDLPNKKDARVLVVTEVQSDIHQSKTSPVLSKADQQSLKEMDSKKNLLAKMNELEKTNQYDNAISEIETKKSEIINKYIDSIAKRNIKKLHAIVKEIDPILNHMNQYISPILDNIESRIKNAQPNASDSLSKRKTNVDLDFIIDNLEYNLDRLTKRTSWDRLDQEEYFTQVMLDEFLNEGQVSNTILRNADDFIKKSNLLKRLKKLQGEVIARGEAEELGRRLESYAIQFISINSGIDSILQNDSELLTALSNGDFSFQPYVPFNSSWSRLSMKASLKHAIDNGFDAIAIVDGKDSARAVGGPGEKLEEAYKIVNKEFFTYASKFGSKPQKGNWKDSIDIAGSDKYIRSVLQKQIDEKNNELNEKVRIAETVQDRTERESAAQEMLQLLADIQKLRTQLHLMPPQKPDEVLHRDLPYYSGDMTVYPITDKMRQEIGPQSLWSRVNTPPSPVPQPPPTPTNLTSREIAQQLSDFGSAKIGYAFDNLFKTLSESAPGRQINALFDQSVLGSLTKVGQRIARLAFGEYKDSVFRMRRDIAPIIRTWVGLDKINEEVIAAKELAPLDDYIRQHGNKAKAESMRMKDARVIRNQRYNGLLRLAERPMLENRPNPVTGVDEKAYVPITPQDVAQEAPWVDASKVDEVTEMINKFRYFNLQMIEREDLHGLMTRFLNRYFPRLRSPLPGASDSPWNPNYGEILDPTHPHQRSRDTALDGYTDGTAVVNDISVDPEFSAVFTKRNIKEDQSSQQIALEIENLARNMWSKYGDRLDSSLTGTRFSSLPRATQDKIKGLAKKMALLDAGHVDNAIPLFSADMVSSMMQRLEHSYRASAHANVIRDLVAEGVLHKSFYHTGDAKATNLKVALKEGDYGSPMAVARVIRHLKRKTKDVIYDADKRIWDVEIEPKIRGINAFINQGQIGQLNPTAYNQNYDMVSIKIADADDSVGINEYDFRFIYDRNDATNTAKHYYEIVEKKPDLNGQFTYEVKPQENPNATPKAQYTSNMPPQFHLQALTIPREVADEIKRFVKPPRLLGELLPLVRYSDKFTNVWKMMQTGMLPFIAFHTRNLGSGQASNLFTGIQSDPRFKLDITDPTSYLNPFKSFFVPITEAHTVATGDTLKGASDIPDFKSKRLNDEQATEKLRQELFALGLTGERQGLSAEQLQESVDAISSQYPGILGPESVNPLRLKFSKPVAGSTFSQRYLQPWMMKGGMAQQDIFRPGQLGKDIAGYTESLNRIAPYIAMRRQGFDPREAARLVNEAQVDYTALSNFNRDYTRRLFPFAAYTLGITPMVAKNLTQRPGGLMGRTVMATTQAGQGDDQGVTPDYIRETASIPLGLSEDGTRSYITGFGLPFEDPLQFAQILKGNVSGTLRELGSRMNPIPKALIEATTGESLYQSGPFGGREIEDLDPTIGRIKANIKDLMTGSKTEQATPIMNSPWLEYAIANSGLGRSLNTVRTATDPRKWDTIPWKLLLNIGTGVRVADVSPSAQDAILRERLARVMKDFGGRMYTRPFFPDYAKEDWTPQEAEDAAKIEAIMTLLNQRSAERKKMREAAAQ